MNNLRNRILGSISKAFVFGGLLSCATLSADNINAPQTALDASGNRVAVWELDLSAGGSNIYAATQASGASSWSTPEIISGSEVQPTAPQIIQSADGQLIAAAWTFVDIDNGITSIAVSTFTFSSGWTDPTVISTTNDDVQQDFNLAISDANQLCIAWNSFSVDSDESHLWHSTLGFGGGWTTLQVF